MWFEFLKWTIATLSLAGVVLNIRRQRICFYIWTATNLAWCIIDLSYGIWAQAALQAVYLGLALWGIIAWRENKNVERP